MEEQPLFKRTRMLKSIQYHELLSPILMASALSDVRLVRVKMFVIN